MMFMIYVLVVLLTLSFAQELPRGTIIQYEIPSSFTSIPNGVPETCNCTSARIWQGRIYLTNCNGCSASVFNISPSFIQNHTSISFPSPTPIQFVTPSIQFTPDSNINIIARSGDLVFVFPLEPRIYINSSLGFFELAQYRYANLSGFFYAPVPHLPNYILEANTGKIFFAKTFSPFMNFTPMRFNFGTLYVGFDEVYVTSYCYYIRIVIREPGDTRIDSTANIIRIHLPTNVVSITAAAECIPQFNITAAGESVRSQTETLHVTIPYIHPRSGTSLFTIFKNSIYSNPDTHYKLPLNIPQGIFLNLNDTKYKYWLITEKDTGRCWFGEALPNSNIVLATMPVQCAISELNSSVGFYNNTINYNNTCKFNYNNTHVIINYTHTLSSPVRVVKINKSGTIVTNVSLNSNAQLVFNRETDYVLGVYTSDFRNVICYYREQYTNMNNNVQRFFHLLFILLSSAVPLSVLFVIPAYAIGIFSNIPVFTIIHALSLSSLIYFFTRGQFHMFTLPIFLIITSVLVNYNIELPSPPSSWGVVETLFALPIALINFIIELFRLPYSLVIHIFNSLPGEFSVFEWLAQTIGIAINTYFILYAFTIIYNRFQR